MISVNTTFDERALSLIAQTSVHKYRFQCYIVAAAVFVLGTLLNLAAFLSIWYELLWCVLSLLNILRPKHYYKKFLKQYITRERELYPAPRTVHSVFEEDRISSLTIENSNTMEIKYAALSKLYENDDYLMLMTEGKQCLPLPKNQITNANYQELTDFLKAKAPNIKHIKIK